MAEAPGENNTSEPATTAAVRRQRQSNRFIVISLFEEDGMGDTGTPWILPLALECLKEPMQINRRDFNYGLALSLGWLQFSRLPLHEQQLRSDVQTLRVKGERIMQHIRGLAEFGTNPQGGVSRVAYSDADKQGREYVLGLLRGAKLDVSVDAAGNLIGRRTGSASGLNPLLIGSHIDTVPDGGN